MRRQLSACVGLVLLLATSAWAQLASQTALVGTVTDSGGAVVPGANVVAVNVGTQDTYAVTVEAKAQVLDTDRPTVSATINERAVVELPLNGRNVWNLAATTPGVL